MLSDGVELRILYLSVESPRQESREGIALWSDKRWRVRVLGVSADLRGMADPRKIGLNLEGRRIFWCVGDNIA